MTASGVKPFVSAPIALPHEEDESLPSEAGRLEVGGGGVGFEPPLCDGSPSGVHVLVQAVSPRADS